MSRANNLELDLSERDAALKLQSKQIKACEQELRELQDGYQLYKATFESNRREAVNALLSKVL